MKKLILLLLILGMLAAGSGFGEESPEVRAGTVVSSYPELIIAVNEYKSDRILISPHYSHKGGTGTDLIIEEGRTVTLMPYEGDSMVINGRIDAAGGGSLIFENIDIVGPNGTCAMWLGEGIHVKAGSVTGGKTRGNHGNTAIYAEDAHVVVDSAAGSDGTIGLGGDGIFATGDSTVEVREARGGSAPKGVGGAGVVAFGGAKVKVTGSATGGAGLYAAGKGVLIGVNSEMSGDGKSVDGTKLTTLRPVITTKIVSLALLENAIRNGETEIHLDPRFNSVGDMETIHYLFCASEEPVKIIGSTKGKNRTIDCGLSFRTGKWELEGIDFAIYNEMITEPCVYATGDAEVTVNGELRTKKATDGCVTAGENARVKVNGDCIGKGNIAIAYGNAEIELNGAAECAGQEYAALKTYADGTIRMNGNVAMNGAGNALSAYGGTIEVNGNLTAKVNKIFPAVYCEGGEIRINGNVKARNHTEALCCVEGSITVNGDVTHTSGRYTAVYVGAGENTVTIHGNLDAMSTAARVLGGTLTVDGDLTVHNKKKVDLFYLNGDGQIIVTGEQKRAEK